MKRSDLLYILQTPILALLGGIAIILFTSYGNKQVHPDLNTIIVQKFLSLNNKGTFSKKEFRNYVFFFEKGVILKGIDITKDGLFSANDVAAAGWGYNYSEEGPAERTPQGWISRGGYTADVPEVPASFRHFYDPAREPGDRYLTDIANAKILGFLQKYVITNPRIDGVDWALGKSGDNSIDAQSHQYTWERGKMWITWALRETNPEKKNEFMAKAWRSLGETLHMIADNGCPPHVRNDAHPAPKYKNITFFGNPDPYEELTDIIRENNPGEFSALLTGPCDAKLSKAFASMKKVRDIAHALALFTNSTFVTNETISGKDKNGNPVKQITHPESSYNSPLLQQLTYEKNDHAYVSATGVKQCTDRYYFADAIPLMCTPFVDAECVKSQASILFPNIIEAGASVIGLFIPKLRVELTQQNQQIQGTIRHQTDAEYPAAIKYEGTVTVQCKNNKYQVINESEVNARNGKFEFGDVPAGTSVIVAYIDFGGVRVNSQEFVIQSAIPVQVAEKPAAGGANIPRILIYVEGTFDNTLTCSGYTNDAKTWIDLESYNIPISQAPGTFKGSKRVGNYFVEVSGTFTENELIEFKYKGKGILGCREQEWDIELQNIPRINKETDDPTHATFQLRPYDNISWKSNNVNMADHVPRMVLKEVSIDNKQQVRTLIETSWGRIVMGSTINISPKNQQSAIEVSFAW